mgnify:CR=1 FL=1
MKQTQRKPKYEKVVFTDCLEAWLLWWAFPKMTAEMLWWASDYLGGMSFEITA